MLKKEVSSNNDVIIIWELLIKIIDRSFVGKKPPEEIIVMAKLRELNALILNKFKIINIINGIDEYNKKIFNHCFRVSALLNDMKFVKDFLKLLSKISINKIIENKK